MENTRQDLIHDLHQKLGDLEHKVQDYRHELVVEFQRYYDQILQDEKPSIALHVEQAIIPELNERYPAFGPALKLAGLRPSSLSHQADSQGRSEIGPSSPPPTAASGATAALERDPHEREKEFQGLFTPLFLPLLESSPPVPESLQTMPSVPLPASGSQVGSEAGVARSADQQGLSAQQAQDMEGSSETGGPRPTTSPAQAQAQIRPESESQGQAASQSATRQQGNGQRVTEPLPTSTSDGSDNKIRRSALRRSSSLSKTQQSPRRVRFEFKGTEVLPTSSPQPFGTPPSNLLPSTTSDNPRSFDDILGDGSGEEDSFVSGLPPRKISSSEALRALSRAPLDESTTWTVVNPGASEGSTSSTTSLSSTEPPASRVQSVPTPVKPLLPPMTTEAVEARQRLAAINLSKDSVAEPGSEESSDEEFLSMGKPRQSASKQNKASESPRIAKEVDRVPSLPAQVPANDTMARPEPATQDKTPLSPDDLELDEEDMFHFEAGGLSAPPPPRLQKPSRPSPPAESPEHSPPASPREARVGSPESSLYGKSPAIPITKPLMSPGPATPTTKFPVGSLGSYKGRPVIVPIVKDPNLHAQAASLGQFNTFVGGLDGRSGMDEGDLNSFRASLAQGDFSGTPRSLTERMMMEEACANRASRG